MNGRLKAWLDDPQTMVWVFTAGSAVECKVVAADDLGLWAVCEVGKGPEWLFPWHAIQRLEFSDRPSMAKGED